MAGSMVQYLKKPDNGQSSSNDFSHDPTDNTDVDSDSDSGNISERNERNESLRELASMCDVSSWIIPVPDHSRIEIIRTRMALFILQRGKMLKVMNVSFLKSGSTNRC
ncbi:hypothetical protein OTU49_003632 [Cherax quadricarinatus]|uniref:Uncharacterized protein n=1 Tax=Cherax quadricarinatus TaxID=27406 RepID=A0AAW0XI63_CHEQU